jgi:2-dehydro-3-deoxygluconokinase
MELVTGPGGNRIVCLGEAMVELSARQGRWDVHYGGDTLNVALHLTRLGFDVAYLTALGSDPFAGSMRTAWGREGLDVSLVLTDPDRTTGLYCIDTDEKGERHFSYWRGESAARRMFHVSGIDTAVETAESPTVVLLAHLACDPARRGARAGAQPARRVRAMGARSPSTATTAAPVGAARDRARVARPRRRQSPTSAALARGRKALGDGTETAETVRDHWLTWGCRKWW